MRGPCAASCVCSKFEVAVTIHLDESQDCDVGRCFLDVWGSGKNAKKDRVRTSSPKGGNDRGTQRRSVTGGQGQKGATETRKRRNEETEGFCKEGE